MSLQARQRMILLAILGLCILPVLLAQLIWQWARPQGGASYGQLLAQPLTTPVGLNLPHRASWQLLAHTESMCEAGNAQQRQLLLTAQQLQKAQGRDQTRITLGSCLPSARSMPTGVYLIDPHGNAVLRYSPQQLADVKGRQAVLREIGKVLKNNQGLG
jgi:hypothetical protein